MPLPCQQQALLRWLYCQGPPSGQESSFVPATRHRGRLDNYSIRVFDFYLGQHRAVSKKHRNAEARRFRSGLNFRMTLNGSNPADKNVVLKCQRWFDTCVSFLEGGRQQTGAIVILAKAGANNGGPESPDCTREIFSPSNFGSAMNLACLVQRTAVCGGRSMRNV